MRPPRPSHVKDLPKGVRDYLFYVGHILSRRVSYGTTMDNSSQDQNIDHWKATGTTPGAANTEFAVNHGLGRIPLGFQVWSVNKAAHLYQSTTAWTTTQIFLKCDVATVNFVIAII
jgi:hypothetical protein